MPVERSAPGLDPMRRSRLRRLARTGMLLALNPEGRELYRYKAGSAIEAQPVVDPRTGEVYFTTVQGTLVALHGQGGTVHWKAEAGAAISQPVAADRGRRLRGHRRGRRARVLADQGRGAVALSPRGARRLHDRRPRRTRAGRQHASSPRSTTARWSRSTPATAACSGRPTPRSISKTWIRRAGSWTWTRRRRSPATSCTSRRSRAACTGSSSRPAPCARTRARSRAITGLTATQDALLIASAELGVMCVDMPSFTPRWQRKIQGAPGQPEVQGDNVYVSESLGALLALALADGTELGRIQTAHGVTARPSLPDAAASCCRTPRGCTPSRTDSALV